MWECLIVKVFVFNGSCWKQFKTEYFHIDLLGLFTLSHVPTIAIALHYHILYCFAIDKTDGFYKVIANFLELKVLSVFCKIVSILPPSHKS